MENMIKNMGFREVRYGKRGSHGLRFLFRDDGDHGRK